jgi:hypothetical protein
MCFMKTNETVSGMRVTTLNCVFIKVEYTAYQQQLLQTCRFVVCIFDEHSALCRLLFITKENVHIFKRNVKYM